MKKLLVICLIFIGSTAFQEANNCSNYGILLGWDSTRCGCCEGWKIEINGQNYLADSIPNAKEFFKSAGNRKYPIPVFVDYESANSGCVNRIRIKCIKPR